jgi:molybdopterin biosynthesis enzyme
VIVARAVWSLLRSPKTDPASTQTVLRAGDRVSAAETGILASVGAAEVAVYGMPVAAVLSTGDELAAPDMAPGTLPFGAVRDSNRPMLLAGAWES